MNLFVLASGGRLTHTSSNFEGICKAVGVDEGITPTAMRKLVATSMVKEGESCDAQNDTQRYNCPSNIPKHSGAEFRGR